MKKRVFIILGIVAALVITFIIGAAVGGGILYTWLHQIQPAFAAQSTEPDPDAGLIVTSVEKDGPASEAGVVRGDIVFSINNLEVNSIADVRQVLRDLVAGDEVILGVLHGNEVRTYQIILEEGGSGGKLGLALCCGRMSSLELEVGEFRNGRPMIIRVLEGSPAEEAGLEPGDLILSIDGEEVDAERSLSEWISQYEPGDQIELEVCNVGEDEIRNITVKLGEHPEIEGKAYLGIQVIQAPQVIGMMGENHEFDFEFPPTDEEVFPFHFYGHKWNSPFTGDGFKSGILITEVIENSPASEAGLEQGDLITALDGESVKGAKSFVGNISSMQPGKKVSLTVLRASSDETLEFEVKLGEHPDDPEAGYLGVHIRGTIHFREFDQEHRFQHWLPFLYQFQFPFEFERKFHLAEPEDL